MQALAFRAGHLRFALPSAAGAASCNGPRNVCSLDFVVQPQNAEKSSATVTNPITGTERHTNTCYATFVALDETGRPARVPPVLAETDDEKRRLAAGQRRREERLQRRLPRKH